MRKHPAVEQQIMTMKKIITDKGTLIPAGSKGKVVSLGTSTDNPFGWEQEIYHCDLDEYPTVDLACSIGGVDIVPEGEFFVIYDVLKGEIYNSGGSFSYITKNDAIKEFDKLSKHCGFYTVAICNQDLQVVDWICWMENIRNIDDENRYYIAAYGNEHITEMEILQNAFGYYTATDLNDLIPWLHNEKAWKSGQNMVVLEARSMEIIAVVPPPPGTPLNGIIAHDFEMMRQNGLRDSDEMEDEE